MKKNKKLIIISGSIVLILLIYFIFIFDSIKISKIVELDSYEDIFNKEQLKIINKNYENLTEEEKKLLLSNLINHDDFRVRVVASRYLADIQDKDFSLKILSFIENENNPLVIEEALTTIKKLKSEKAQDILISFINKQTEKIDFNIPLSEIGQINVWGLPEAKKIYFRVQEKDQADIKLNDRQVYDINILFPADPEWFLYFPAFNKNYSKFINSDFIEELTSLGIYQEFDKAPIISKYYEVKKILDEKFGVLSGFIEPDNLFQDNLSIAKYNDNFLLVTFASDNTKIFDLLSKSGSISSSLLKINSFDIFSNPAVEISFNNTQLFFSKIDEYLIFSTSKDLLTKSLDIYLNSKTSSLGADPVFNFYYKLLDHKGKKTYLYLFTSPAKLLSIKGDEHKSAYLCRKALQTLNLIKKSKYIIKNEKLIKSEHNTKLYDFSKNDLINFAFNNFSLTRFWKYTKSVRSLSTFALDSLLKLISFDPDTSLFNFTNDKIHISFQGIDYSVYPYNYSALKTVIIIPISNPQEVEKSMLKMYKAIFNQNPLKANFEGVDYYTFSDTNTSYYEGYDPLPRNFAIYNNYLFISQKKELIFEKINLLNSNSSKYYPENNYFLLKMDTKNTLINFYKFLVRYGFYSGKMRESEIEKDIKPLFKHLSKINKINLIINETDDLIKGNLTLSFENDKR